MVLAAAICLSAVVVGQSKKTGNLIKEGGGVDGINVGVSTSDDVIKKYGKVYLWEKNQKYSYQMTYLDRGLSFYMCQADKKEVIFLIEIKPPFQGKTSKGLALGQSTKEEAEKLYGPPLDTHDDLEYPGVNLIFSKSGNRTVVSEIDIVESSGIRQCDDVP